jgi:hypothetical protein
MSKHLPCKKDKCILYPSCVSKHMIDCIPLREYYQYYKRERQVKPKTIWKAINTVLPYVQSIVGPLNESQRVPQYYYRKNIMNPRMQIYYQKGIIHDSM